MKQAAAEEWVSARLVASKDIPVAERPGAEPPQRRLRV